MTWDDVLDDLEKQAENLAAGDVEGWPEPFAPPANLGPLPERLADRAAEVLDKMLAAVTVAADKKADLVAEAAASDAAMPRRPARPDGARDDAVGFDTLA